jgi:hypothetical protein
MQISEQLKNEIRDFAVAMRQYGVNWPLTYMPPNPYIFTRDARAAFQKILTGAPLTDDDWREAALSLSPEIFPSELLGSFPEIRQFSGFMPVQSPEYQIRKKLADALLADAQSGYRLSNALGERWDNDAIRAYNALMSANSDAQGSGPSASDFDRLIWFLASNRSFVGDNAPPGLYTAIDQYFAQKVPGTLSPPPPTPGPYAISDAEKAQVRRTLDALNRSGALRDIVATDYWKSQSPTLVAALNRYLTGQNLSDLDWFSLRVALPESGGALSAAQHPVVPGPIPNPFVPLNLAERLQSFQGIGADAAKEAGVMAAATPKNSVASGTLGATVAATLSTPAPPLGGSPPAPGPPSDLSRFLTPDYVPLYIDMARSSADTIANRAGGANALLAKVARDYGPDVANAYRDLMAGRISDFDTLAKVFGTLKEVGQSYGVSFPTKQSLAWDPWRVFANVLLAAPLYLRQPVTGEGRPSTVLDMNRIGAAFGSYFNGQKNPPGTNPPTPLTWDSSQGFGGEQATSGFLDSAEAILRATRLLPYVKDINYWERNDATLKSALNRYLRIATGPLNSTERLTQDEAQALREALRATASEPIIVSLFDAGLLPLVTKIGYWVKNSGTLLPILEKINRNEPLSPSEQNAYRRALYETLAVAEAVGSPTVVSKPLATTPPSLPPLPTQQPPQQEQVQLQPPVPPLVSPAEAQAAQDRFAALQAGAQLNEQGLRDYISALDLYKDASETAYRQRLQQIGQAKAEAADYAIRQAKLANAAGSLPASAGGASLARYYAATFPALQSANDLSLQLENQLNQIRLTTAQQRADALRRLGELQSTLGEAKSNLTLLTQQAQPANQQGATQFLGTPPTGSNTNAFTALYAPPSQHKSSLDLTMGTGTNGFAQSPWRKNPETWDITAPSQSLGTTEPQQTQRQTANLDWSNWFGQGRSGGFPNRASKNYWEPAPGTPLYDWWMKQVKAGKRIIWF